MGGITLASNAGLKALSLWDPNRYCNIWIVRSLSSTVGSQILGYAQFPAPMAAGTPFFQPQTDGVVLRSDELAGTLRERLSGVFDTYYSSTLAHELGHWLGLYHTFEGGCAETDCRTQGDNVCDTPPVQNEGQANRPGSGRFNSCVVGIPDLPDQIQNTMDVVARSLSIASTFFTRGQRQRVYGFLADAGVARRYSLWQEANLQATGTGKWGPLTPIFWANNTRTHVGKPVTFEDYTRNTPTQYSWSFEGNPVVDLANPAAPVVVWSAPGTYTVSLTVSNNYGSATATLQNYITVVDEREPIPYTEGFVYATFPGKLRIENPDSLSPGGTTLGLGWQHTENAGPVLANQDLDAVVLRNWLYADPGQADYLYLPFFNLSAVGCAELGLRLAYQPVYLPEQFDNVFSATNNAMLYTDTLAVEGSIDGGASWIRLYKAGGLDLMTTANPDTLYTAVVGGGLGLANSDIPVAEAYKWLQIKTPTDWQNEPVVQLRIKNLSGQGGALFIDSLSLTPSTDCVALPPPPVGRTAASAREAARLLRIFPQPAQGYVQLAWDGTHDLSGPLLLLDAQGRTVRDYGLLSLHPASVSPELSLAELPAGMYWLRWAQLPATPVLKP
jgi:PKD repeat protein